MNYDTADFYDCRDSEVFTHETPGAAIQDYLDGWATPHCDVAALIATHTPVTVRAYKQRTVEPEYKESFILGIEEHFEEAYAEEFGDPDGGATLDGIDEARPMLKAWLDKVLAASHVWACELVGERTYSAEEVLALMREECPEWFNGDGTPKEAGA